jgi:hypothetical protein
MLNDTSFTDAASRKKRRLHKGLCSHEPWMHLKKKRMRKT